MVTITRDAYGKNLSTSETRKSKSDPVPPIPQEATTPDWVDRHLESFQSRMVVLGAFFTAMAGLLGLFTKIVTDTPLGGFVQSPDKAAEVGTIAAARDQLSRLFAEATWRGNRIVVFIDDIERCKPPRAVDVLDAVNQLVNQRGVIVIFLGDMSAVAAAAQLKYKDLAEIFVPSAGIALNGPDRGKEAFGRLYLQKIIQFQFDLPIPPMEKIHDYMKGLAAASQGGDDGRN